MSERNVSVVRDLFNAWSRGDLEAFLGLLDPDSAARLQRPDSWGRARNTRFSMWTRGAEHTELAEFIARDTGAYDFAMWSRGAREIERAYSLHGCPLQAVQKLAASSQFPMFEVAEEMASAIEHFTEQAHSV